MYDSHNIFAKILRGDIPCKKIFENDHALSFYDAFPRAKIHALVIPKGEFENFLDFQTHATFVPFSSFYAALTETLKILNLAPSGFKLITRSGKDGGQEVPHFHVHILGGQQLDETIDS
ncbi:hypothetical protein AGMMS49949_03790 [Alphaproteobacteria bacterium]|nr:hypothetical protein AGMMS49949_03790 [Alphaproteobacteria bacterium]GHS96605.1 hypothetical protein AGMMS50296_2930 [Alphaproteobacteria bacterium]